MSQRKDTTMSDDVYSEDPTFGRVAVQKLEEALPGAVLGKGEYRGQIWATIAADRIVEVCTFLRDHEELRCDYLRDLCGVDNLNYADEETRFQVVYHLYSLDHAGLLRLKVDLDEDEPEVDSVVGVWAAADWQERETYDMYGIRFRGHPDLRRIMMPESYRYFPQRKDFPIEGIHDIEGV